MKKKLVALMAVLVMAMTSVYAAEAKGPVLKWRDNTSSKVTQKEKQTNSQITSNKKAKLQARATERAKKQKLQEQKAKERKIKVEAKKQQLREMFQ